MTVAFPVPARPPAPLRKNIHLSSAGELTVSAEEENVSLLPQTAAAGLVPLHHHGTRPRASTPPAMPKPAVVIVVRHGARLDAADKQWHITSPTPYDPPLTYGGWQQAKALGLRIAALLHARENEAKNGDADATSAAVDALGAGKAANGAAEAKLPKKKKKHRVVLHTSPFLRCIQTSTGIAAGMAQFQPPKESKDVAETTTATKLSIPRPSLERNGSLGSSVLAKSPRTLSPAVQPVRSAEHATDAAHDVPKARSGPPKVLLRIDAFLGEWLSPDYFEHITPPPNSTMMVAGAKADLLRRGDYIEVHHVAPQNRGHFPGGWKASSPTATRKTFEDVSFLGMGSLAQALPHRERSSSGSGPLVRTRSRENAAALATAHKVPSHVYDPPIPSYPVSSASPIPRGYVSHARDACVEVDWQWDSMREPQEWGDGGEYGDEWSTMHKRFRRGLVGMMKWYSENGATAPKDQFRGFTFSERPKAPIHAATDPGPKADHEKLEEEEDDEDLVLILVTHGAGCNALLGAISNQPILIDVGLAALSMAVRRDQPRRPSMSVIQRPPSVANPGMSDTYEMKYLASLDHLRPGIDPAKLPQSQSPAGIASPAADYRRRVGINSGSAHSPISGVDSFTLGEPLRSGWNSALGSIRRSSTSGPGSSSRTLSSGSTMSHVTSTGLWSSPKVPSSDHFAAEGRQSPGADMVLNFANQAPKSTTSSSKSPTNSAVSTETTPTTSVSNLDGASDIGLGINDSSHDDEKDDSVAPLRRTAHTSRSSSMSTGSSGLWAPKNQAVVGNGLWGPPIMEEVFEHRYEHPKRRWTVSENE